MAKAPLGAGPSDVLAVGGGQGTMAKLIRIGGLLKGGAGVANHVIIITHQDQRKRWMGIEGRPGGVGLVDATPWLADRYTRTNHAQPRPPAGSQAMDKFLKVCAASIGVRYDWVGIAQDTAAVLGKDTFTGPVNEIWKWEDGEMPGAVVCSSLAAMLYDQAGWKHPPGAERNTTPADWYAWNDSQAWEAS
jgi:hypothetical protein